LPALEITSLRRTAAAAALQTEIRVRAIVVQVGDRAELLVEQRLPRGGVQSRWDRWSVQPAKLDVVRCLPLHRQLAGMDAA
jgi:hypothetical protein